MNEKELEKQLVALLREKKKIEGRIDKLERELVRELCLKGKTECEPAYCTFRLTSTCPFIKKWSKILDEVC